MAFVDKIGDSAAVLHAQLVSRLSVITGTVSRVFLAQHIERKIQIVFEGVGGTDAGTVPAQMLGIHLPVNPFAEIQVLDLPVLHNF